MFLPPSMRSKPPYNKVTMNEITPTLEATAIYRYAQQWKFSDVLKLLADWDVLAHNKDQEGAGILLPNLFVNVDPGTELTPFCRYLADFLKERRLMPFEGKCPFYLFSLYYSGSGENERNQFPAFEALYDIVRHKINRFARPYQGLIVVDITSWVNLGATSEEKFGDFLAFMSTLDEDTLALFVSSVNNAKLNEEAYRSLVKRSRLKSIDLRLKDPELGLSFLRGELAKQGLQLSEEASHYLEASVQALLAARSGPLRQCLSQLALDISYAKYLNPGVDKHTLSLDDVRFFGADGDWVKAYTANHKNSYGLLGRDEG